tara:strand:- start:377 stop:565 length:189 start_codon:yes stop_codon:yes gene_type:complete
MTELTRLELLKAYLKVAKDWAEVDAEYEAKLRAEYQKITKDRDHGEALIDARIKALEGQDYA